MEAYPDHKGSNKEEILRFEEMVKNNEPFYFDVETYEDFIHHYVAKGQFAKGLKTCEIGLEQHPYSSELLYQKAQLHFDLGEYQTALDAIAKVENFQPFDTEVITLKGSVFLELEKYQMAIECFEQLEQISIEEKDFIYYHLGEAYLGLEEYDIAIEYFKKTLELNPMHEEALFELVTTLDIAEREGECVEIYQKLVDKDPYDAGAWYNLGVVYDKLSEYAKASEAYDYAILIDENFASAHYNKGLALLSSGKYGEAIACFEKTIEIEGAKDSNLLVNLGNCFLKQEEYGQAIKYYQKAVVVDEQNHIAYSGIGLCLYEQEKWLEAAHFFGKAVELNPVNETYLFSKADTEYKVGNIISSLEDYEKLVSLNEQYIEAWLNWSFIVYEQGDIETAIDLTLTAIDKNPEDAELYYRVTAYMIEKGIYKEAFIYLENALILDYEKHTCLFEFFPDLETQKALVRIIDQFR